MKKIIGVLAAVGVALALVGCDTVGTNGNPVDLTGTWTNVKQTVNSTDTTPAANGKEGTWSYHNVQYPTPTNTYTNADSSVTTTVYHDTTTRTVDSSMVITVDGSYVKTTTITDNRAARATIAAVSTGAAQTAGYPEVIAQKVVYTEVETVTVVPDGIGYRETKVTTKTEVRTGGATGFAGTTTKTDTTDTYRSTPGSLSFNTATFNVTDYVGQLFYAGQNESGSYTQTVVGTTMPAASGIASTTVTTTVLAIVADGTYTKTTTVLLTIPAKAAVAATATSSATLAVAAGTQTTTTVETGSVTSNTVTNFQGATPTATAYFVPTASNVTRIATGSGISTGVSNYSNEFGATALSIPAAYSNWSNTFYIVKGSGQTPKTNLILGSDVYSKS